MYVYICIRACGIDEKIFFKRRKIVSYRCWQKQYPGINEITGMIRWKFSINHRAYRNITVIPDMNYFIRLVIKAKGNKPRKHFFLKSKKPFQKLIFVWAFTPCVLSSFPWVTGFRSFKCKHGKRYNAAHSVQLTASAKWPF